MKNKTIEDLFFEQTKYGKKKNYKKPLSKGKKSPLRLVLSK